MARERAKPAKREFKFIATGKFHIPLADLDDENRPINKIVRQGDKLLSHRDLVTLWPGKFVEVTKEVQRQDAGPTFDLTNKNAMASSEDVKTPAGKGEATNEVVDEDTTAAASQLGDNVTEDFEGASPDYEVYKDGKEFFVVKAGEATPLNEKPLRRAKVERFISEIGKETSEDEE